MRGLENRDTDAGQWVYLNRMLTVGVAREGGALENYKGQIIVSPITQSTYDLLVVELTFVGVHESPLLNGNLRAF